MCGIVGGFTQDIQRGVQALLHRGPDAQGIVQKGEISFGHTRLAILDLDARSNQPFCYQSITLVFNGEIWNYKTLRQELQACGHIFTTEGDTEVLASALTQWGVDALLRLDGMFAVAWTEDGETLYLARDRFGEIPLHIAKQRPFLFASEKKALLALHASPKSFDMLAPGHYACVTQKTFQQHQYYNLPTIPYSTTRQQAASRLFSLLEAGTDQRTISDVPVCTLLSGGIDSSVIAFFLAQVFPNLVAFTAVYNQSSRDLKMARVCAKFLGIELREIRIPLPREKDIYETIRAIEMPYKAQVEIGWPCLCLARQIQQEGFKVVFSGEGSDELWGSYGFAYHALKTQNYHQYRKDLFLSQSRKNFMRCNNIFLAHGIECRLPFLHVPLVEYAISLPRNVVSQGTSSPKKVLQQAFHRKIPDEIIFRPKVAFQDGMGLKAVIARQFSNPKRFYGTEYKKLYG